MRTEQITIYQFEELSEVAQEKAMTDYSGICGYIHEDEAFKSIQKLAEHFHGRVTNWSVDFFGTSYSYMEFEMPNDMSTREIRRLLKKLGTYNIRTGKGHGECKLTGYCADEDCIDGFRGLSGVAKRTWRY